MGWDNSVVGRLEGVQRSLDLGSEYLVGWVSIRAVTQSFKKMKSNRLV